MKSSLAMVCLAAALSINIASGQQQRSLQTDGVPVGYGAGINGPQYPTTPPKTAAPNTSKASSEGSMSGSARAGLAGIVGVLVAMIGTVYGVAILRQQHPKEPLWQAARFPNGRRGTLSVFVLTSVALGLTIGGLVAKNFVSFTPLFGDNVQGNETHVDAAWRAGRFFGVLTALFGTLLAVAAYSNACVRYSPNLLAILVIGHALTAMTQLFVFLLYAGELCDELAEQVYGHSCVMMHGGNASAAAFVFWIGSAIPYVTILQAAKGEEEIHGDEEQGNTTNPEGGPSNVVNPTHERNTIQRPFKKSIPKQASSAMDDSKGQPILPNQGVTEGGPSKATDDPTHERNIAERPPKKSIPDQASSASKGQPILQILKATNTPNQVVYQHQQATLQITQDSVSCTRQERVGTSVLMSIPREEITSTKATKACNEYHKLLLITNAGRTHMLTFSTRESLERARKGINGDVASWNGTPL